MPLILAVLLLLAAAAARADSAVARVTHVGDGDSLTVCLNGREARVRLAGIDAPEYRQAFGRQARASLAGLCENHAARLAWERADRYGRILARVFCQGLDVNAEQVRRGFAWVSDLDGPQPELSAAQQAARERRAGLWKDPAPVPPWQWRKADRAERRPQRTGAWTGAEGPECAP